MNENLLTVALTASGDAWEITLNDNAPVLTLEGNAEAWAAFERINSTFSIHQDPRGRYELRIWKSYGDRDVIDERHYFGYIEHALGHVEQLIAGHFDAETADDDPVLPGDVLEHGEGLTVFTPAGPWHLDDDDSTALLMALTEGVRRRMANEPRTIRRPVSQTGELAHIADFHS